MKELKDRPLTDAERKKPVEISSGTKVRGLHPDRVINDDILPHDPADVWRDAADFAQNNPPKKEQGER